MSGSFLAIDVGNSCCKVALYPAPDAQGQRVASLPTDADLVRRLLLALAGLQDVGAVGLASVADAQLSADLEAALRARFELPVRCNPDAGLTLGVDHPETVGADRLYAARGALQLARAPLVVVDAGTALTVDAVGPRAEFMGGAIAPGPQLLARSLQQGGARLPQVEPQPRTPALGRDTAGALAAGVAVGFEGSALHLVRRVAAEAGFERPSLVLTGGARAFVEPALAREHPGLRVDPDLVLRGLVVACRGAAAEQA